MSAFTSGYLPPGSKVNATVHIGPAPVTQSQSQSPSPTAGGLLVWRHMHTFGSADGERCWSGDACPGWKS